MGALPQTPSQTIGPFFHFALPFEGGERLVPPGDPDAVRVVGAVYDGAGEPAPDAMVEIWQANRAGRYAHPEDRRDDVPLEGGFAGFGRCSTDAEGRYAFVTVKPGAVPGLEKGTQAPHINVLVFARGLLKQLATRIYFPDEEEANAKDPLLSSIGAPDLRATLISRRLDGAYEFDIHLQGEKQTAFLDV